MPRVRKPTVAEPEIVVMPGNPLVIGHAPRAREVPERPVNAPELRIQYGIYHRRERGQWAVGPLSISVLYVKYLANEPCY